jgi:hypothetical protein
LDPHVKKEKILKNIFRRKPKNNSSEKRMPESPIG